MLQEWTDKFPRPLILLLKRKLKDTKSFEAVESEALPVNTPDNFCAYNKVNYGSCHRRSQRNELSTAKGLPPFNQLKEDLQDILKVRDSCYRRDKEFQRLAEDVFSLKD